MTTGPLPGRRGRRPAGEDTRAQIVEAARAEFAEKGYDGTSMRAVARQAGVDPALVHHYFDGKADLFARAVVQAEVNPAALIDAVVHESHGDLGGRIILGFLAVWDDPANNERLVAMLRGAQASDEVGDLFREFITREVIGRFAHEAEPSGAPMRGALVASQILGLATARYVLRLEPLASATAADLARWVGPTIQRYLTGPS